MQKDFVWHRVRILLLTGVALLAGIFSGLVWGSVIEGVDIFVIVRDSLPPPWCFLPMEPTTTRLWLDGSEMLTAMLLVALRWIDPPRWWRRAIAVLVCCGVALFVSVFVVAQGEREGPRWTLEEKVLFGGIGFAFQVFMIGVYFLIFYWLVRIVRYGISRTD